MRKLLPFLLALLPSVALGQGAITQNGPVSQFDVVRFARDHVGESAGGLQGRNGRGVNPFAIVDNNGLALCDYNTAPISSATHVTCIGHDSAGNPIYTIDGTVYNFAPGNGTLVGPSSSTIPNAVVFNSTSGLLAKDAGFPPIGGYDIVLLGAADRTGNIDAATAVTTTIAATTAKGGYPVVLGAGTYLLNSTPTSGPLTTYLSLPGVRLTGAGSLDAIADPDSFSVSDWTGIGVAKRLLKAGSGAGGSANQVTFSVQAIGAPTSSAASYEKLAAYFRAKQLDPSTAGINRDLSSFDGIMEMAVSDGRGWGGHSLCLITFGIVPRLCIGHEAEIDNSSGTDATPYISTVGAQYALHVDNKGANKMTAGIFLEGLMFDGFVTAKGTGSKDFIAIIGGTPGATETRPYHVDFSGNIVGAGLQFSTGTDLGHGPILVASGTSSVLESQSASGAVVSHTLQNTAVSPSQASYIIATGTANSSLTLNVNEATTLATILTGAALTSGLSISSARLQVANGASWAAPAAVATVLGSIGPTGSHTTVQKWFKLYADDGNPYYLPAF